MSRITQKWGLKWGTCLRPHFFAGKKYSFAGIALPYQLFEGKMRPHFLACKKYRNATFAVAYQLFKLVSLLGQLLRKEARSLNWGSVRASFLGKDFLHSGGNSLFLRVFCF